MGIINEKLSIIVTLQRQVVALLYVILVAVVGLICILFMSSI